MLDLLIIRFCRTSGDTTVPTCVSHLSPSRASWFPRLYGCLLELSVILLSRKFIHGRGEEDTRASGLFPAMVLSQWPYGQL